MIRFIINTPDIKSPAGVSNHYLGLKDFFSDGAIYNQYKTGSYIRRTLSGYPRFIQVTLRGFLMIRDVLKFVALIIRHKSPVILLNPSFGKKAMQRDELFLRIAKIFCCKVAVFIHGWDKAYFKEVMNGEIKLSRAWNKSDCFFVLASEFKQGLRDIGIKPPIHLTTTKVSDRLVEGFKRKPIDSVSNILFLARVTKEKGIYTTIDAFKIAKQLHGNLKLTVVGMGEELANAKNYVTEEGVPDVVFTGPLSGQELRKAFSEAHVYILPTHSEGMPTSVLEAMAFGLPVITRPVGGLVDFFEEGHMGYLLESLDAKDYAERITSLVESPDLARTMSVYNEDYANRHFLASKVAKELESKLRSL